MTVQVIQPQKQNQVECYRCKAVLQYTYNDIQQKTCTDYLGSRDIVNYITCPLCQNDVSVSRAIK